LIGEEDIAFRQESVQGSASGVGSYIEGDTFFVGVEGAKTRAALATGTGSDMAQAIAVWWFQFHDTGAKLRQ